METLLDLLSDLIPAVIIIASFLLPAFLRKKSQDKAKLARPGAKPKAKRSGAELEDKIRRFFQDLQGEKKARPEAGTGEPAPYADETASYAEEPTRYAEEAAERAPDFERAPFEEAAPRPQPSRSPAPEPATLSAAAPEKAPFSFDRDAPAFEPVTSLEGENEDGNAYAVAEDAYAVLEDAYAILEDVHRIEGEEPSDIVSMSRDSIIAPRSKADEITALKAKLKSTLEKQTAAARALIRQRGEAPLIASLGGREIWKAIVLKEILDRPVGLKGFTTDLMW
jgi:hypothetical protein